MVRRVEITRTCGYPNTTTRMWAGASPNSIGGGANSTRSSPINVKFRFACSWSTLFTSSHLMWWRKPRKCPSKNIAGRYIPFPPPFEHAQLISTINESYCKEFRVTRVWPLLLFLWPNLPLRGFFYVLPPTQTTSYQRQVPKVVCKPRTGDALHQYIWIRLVLFLNLKPSNMWFTWQAPYAALVLDLRSMVSGLQ